MLVDTPNVNSTERRTAARDASTGTEQGPTQQIARWLLFLVLCRTAGGVSYLMISDTNSNAFGGKGKRAGTNRDNPTKVPTRYPSLRPTDSENAQKDVCEADPTRIWITSETTCNCGASWPACHAKRSSPCCLRLRSCSKEPWLDPKYGFRYKTTALDGSNSTICRIAGNATQESENMKTQCEHAGWEWTGEHCQRRIPLTLVFVNGSIRDHGDGLSFRVDYPGNSYLHSSNVAAMIASAHVFIARNKSVPDALRFCVNGDPDYSSISGAFNVAPGTPDSTLPGNSTIRVMFVKKRDIFDAGVHPGEAIYMYIRLLVKRDGSRDHPTDCAITRTIVQPIYDAMCSAESATCLPAPQIIPATPCSISASEAISSITASRCAETSNDDSINIMPCDVTRSLHSISLYSNATGKKNIDCNVFLTLLCTKVQVCLLIFQ